MYPDEMTISLRPKCRKSINSLFRTLGASKEDVYTKPGNLPASEQGTIYSRYTIAELQDMAKRLRKESLALHPDRHQYNKQFYAEEFSKTEQAYNRIMRILESKGG